MRITLQINDDLFARAKALAEEEGRTLDSVIEEGLVLVLDKRDKPSRKKFTLPVSKSKGGTLPGVDLDNWASLEEIMEDDRIFRTP
ncbi:MAG: DUF2191 domain-containing protein [Candidatus Omnitrophica bacterium]|nr:DUF2191 domain-containing protein [Candidatus Omnitrophota bacterium]